MVLPTFGTDPAGLECLPPIASVTAIEALGHSGSVSPERAAAFATSIPPPTRLWNARARPDRSAAKSASKLSAKSATSSFVRNSISTSRAMGAIVLWSACRNASRLAVPSPVRPKRTGARPQAANTSSEA